MVDELAGMLEFESVDLMVVKLVVVMVVKWVALTAACWVEKLVFLLAGY